MHRESNVSPVREKRTRGTNIELMRCLLMYLIVAHHYVMNSGVTRMWTSDTLTSNAAFLTLWGMWGKTAITRVYECGDSKVPNQSTP